MDGQGTTWRRNIAENFNRLSRVHQRYRRQTDDRRQTTDGPSMTYSEHELEFTFAKNCANRHQRSIMQPDTLWLMKSSDVCPDEQNGKGGYKCE